MPKPKEHVVIDGQEFAIPDAFSPEQRRQLHELADLVEETLEGDLLDDEGIVLDLPPSDPLVLSELAQFCRWTEAKYRIAYWPNEEEGEEGRVQFEIKPAKE